MRSGHTWRLNFTLRNQWTYIIHVELKNINIYILYNNTDLITCLHKKECHSIRLQSPTKLNVFVLCLQLIMTRDLLVFLWQKTEHTKQGSKLRLIPSPMRLTFSPWQLIIVPSFSQHNLRLVVSGRYLHVSVTKYQDNFSSLRQVNSPNSWGKFQICCTDMYLIRFLLNFVVFRVFLWISWLCSCSKYPKPCTYQLHHLHFTNWRLKI